jgi:ABC-type multidrug transport system ATPase subunit
LWNVIRTAKTHSSVLTTTHSMEEAEALCSRVGIFVDGRLRLVGPPAVLKSDYGEHFKLNITVNPEDNEAARAFISNRFPTAEVFNSPVLGTTIYQLSRDSVSLSDLFSGCLELEEELQVNTWGISNITLEEVFLKITLEILDKGSDFLKTENKKRRASSSQSDSSSATSLYSQ